MMCYMETHPPIDLAPWIASYWRFSVEPSAGEIEHRVPLTGGTMMSVLPGGDLMLSGPRLAPLVTTVRGGEEYFGVHFLPGAATALLGVPVANLVDAIGPARLWIDSQLADLLAVGAGDQDFASWSALFRERAAECEPPHPTVRLAVALIAYSCGSASIENIARECGASPRALRRLFAEHVGMAPKELARIVRLRAAAAGAVTGGESWVEAASRGFSDQPHLVREFRSILGVTPREFEQHAKRIAHTLV